MIPYGTLSTTKTGLRQAFYSKFRFFATNPFLFFTDSRKQPPDALNVKRTRGRPFGRFAVQRQACALKHFVRRLLPVTFQAASPSVW